MAGPSFCPSCGGALRARDVEGKPRPVCERCGSVFYLDPKVAVAVIVPWGAGIILGRRAIDPGRGAWSFPSGYVDRGEVVEEAALRETREETGLEIDITGLIGVYSEHGNAVIVIAYAAEPLGGSLRAEDDLIDLQGFDPDNLPEMAFPHDTRIVRDWLALRDRLAVSR